MTVKPSSVPLVKWVPAMAKYGSEGGAPEV